MALRGRSFVGVAATDTGLLARATEAAAARFPAPERETKTDAY